MVNEFWFMEIILSKIGTTEFSDIIGLTLETILKSTFSKTIEPWRAVERSTINS